MAGMEAISTKDACPGIACALYKDRVEADRRAKLLDPT